MSILEVNGLKKVYATRFGGNKVEALKKVTFSVEEGEYVAIMGESGSGSLPLRRSAGITWDSYSRTLTCWIHFHWKTTSTFRWCCQGSIMQR